MYANEDGWRELRVSVSVSVSVNVSVSVAYVHRDKCICWNAAVCASAISGVGTHYAPF